MTGSIIQTKYFDEASFKSTWQLFLHYTHDVFGLFSSALIDEARKSAINIAYFSLILETRKNCPSNVITKIKRMNRHELLNFCKILYHNLNFY